jgi:hypothetical protein
VSQKLISGKVSPDTPASSVSFIRLKKPWNRIMSALSGIFIAESYSLYGLRLSKIFFVKK